VGFNRVATIDPDKAIVKMKKSASMIQEETRSHVPIISQKMFEGKQVETKFRAIVVSGISQCPAQ